MQYICLVYHEEKKLKAMPDAELSALVGECVAWVAELEKGGHHVISAGLQSVRTATTLRKRDGMLAMSDGPFAETKEFLGGFTIINAKDRHEAFELASKLPAVRLGSIEVRPILEPGSESTDPLDQKIATALCSQSHP